MPRILSLTPPLLLVVCFACQPATFEEDSADEVGDGDSETGDGDGDPTGDGDSGDGDPTFNCDPTAEMPCPDGQKCTVLISGGPPVYECITDDIDKLPYESCVPAPATGQDGCPSGHACIAGSQGSAGVCMPLCTGDTDCDAALCTAPPGSQVPVCAAICDPLAPLCPDLQDCQRVRKANFVCQFPLEDDDGTTAEACNGALDLGCAEGFVCETGGIIPGCNENSCCTSLCDLSEADPCMAPMVCGGLPLDPQPGLENVGACYVPQ
ncbi:MAG TPA: hypothetical protein VM869_07095 [Enhygromyxa sp.]|nr:hypothetical protein [Enhygromyxa sp.]